MKLTEFHRKALDAFFSDFGGLVDWSECEELRVREMMDGDLEDVPCHKGSTGSLTGIDDERQIFIVDSEGEKYRVTPSRRIHHNEAHSDNENTQGETVGESLQRTRLDLEQLQCIIVKHTGYEVRNHYSVGGYAVEILLPSGGVAEAFRAKQIQALEEVAAMLGAEVRDVPFESWTAG